MMAATDTITIDIEGVGGHAARPQFTVDPILVGAQIISQMQSVVARNVDPLDSAVISICVFQAGTAENIIPQTVRLRGTARSFVPQVRELLERRLHELVEGIARAHGAKAKLTYRRGYPVTRNHEAQTAFAAHGGGGSGGRGARRYRQAPVMGGGGLFLHAASAARRLHFHRQRRFRRPASSGL